MRSVAMFVLGLLVGCSSHPVPTPSSESPRPRSVNVRALEDQTIALVARGEEGASIYCSGVWISRQGIITAAHCVDDVPSGSSVLYATRGDFFPEKIRMQTAVVRTVDAAHDLALLWAATPEAHRVARPFVGTVEVGSRVHTMGHPLGAYWYSYSSGDIASIREGAFDGTTRMVWIQSTAPISHGSSGSGLFDGEGQVLGVAARVSEDGQNVNAFVPWRYVAELIRSQGGQ